MQQKPLAGLFFVITGEFGEARDSIVQKLQSLGAIRNSGITSKTNLIIAGDNPGEAKLKMARLQGIPQADRAWLVRALALGGYTLKDQKIALENV